VAIHEIRIDPGRPLAGQPGNESDDITLAARNALRAMIDHLVSGYGYTRQQA
jgi:hypothetical protein